MILYAILAMVQTASADHSSMQGISITPRPVTNKPIDVVVHLTDEGKMLMVTVTHLNHTTTILPRDWRGDLDRHLASIRNDFGRGVPRCYTTLRGNPGLADLRMYGEVMLHLERRGFAEVERQTGYR
jgi:hypothetical protein